MSLIAVDLALENLSALSTVSGVSFADNKWNWQFEVLLGNDAITAQFVTPLTNSHCPTVSVKVGWENKFQEKKRD